MRHSVRSHGLTFMAVSAVLAGVVMISPVVFLVLVGTGVLLIVVSFLPAKFIKPVFKVLTSITDSVSRAVTSRMVKRMMKGLAYRDSVDIGDPRDN